MCYSKEVQLITGILIFLSCLISYLYFRLKFSKYPTWFKPFFNNIILTFICIGTHQLFEFLSLITNSQIIYKIGLLISMSSLYFGLRSLEVLTNRKVHSKIALLMLIPVAMYNFLITMDFKAFSFHLSHSSAFIWAILWFLIFIYLHVCAFTIRAELKDKESKKAIIYYLLAMVDISFILSVIYTAFGYFKYSVNVCTDSPSIWCTFFVIQSFFIPFFLTTLPFMFKRPIKEIKNPLRKTLFYLFISLIILILLILTLPFFNCLSWKIAFP